MYLFNCLLLCISSCVCLVIGEANGELISQLVELSEHVDGRAVQLLREGVCLSIVLVWFSSHAFSALSRDANFRHNTIWDFWIVCLG